MLICIVCSLNLWLSRLVFLCLCLLQELLVCQSLSFKLTLSDCLELKNIELVSLLGIVDPLDQSVVAHLESVHFNGTLLLQSHSFDLLFCQLLGLFICFLGLSSVFLLLTQNFYVSLLSCLNRSD